MPVTLRAGQTRTKTYNVRGATLQALWEQIKRSKGPKDPNDNQRYSGLCQCDCDLIVPRGTRSLEFAMDTQGNNKTCEISLARAQLVYSFEITLPKLSGSLDRESKREWDRFKAAVLTHERGHVKSYVKVAKRFKREVEQMSWSGTGRNDDAAKRSAVSAMSTALNRFKADMDTRIGQDAARYDLQTNHGEDQQATLHYSAH